MTTEVLPFSPRELARVASLPPTPQWPPGAAQRSALDALIVDYLVHGGFPAVHAMPPYDRIQQHQEYADLVVLRDVVERHGVTNLPALRGLVAGLFASTSNGFSVSRFHGALTSQGIRVGKDTLHSYLAHLVDAYLVFLVPLRTRSARQRAVNPRKVYAIDPGLAAAMYRAGAVNRGAQLENAVYLSLRHKYGRLAETIVGWYKTKKGHEVDFAVDDPVVGGPPQLIQVSKSLEAPKTRARELRALEEAMVETGCTKATVVTLFESDEVQTSSGVISIIPAREWFFRRR